MLKKYFTEEEKKQAQQDNLNRYRKNHHKEILEQNRRRYYRDRDKTLIRRKQLYRGNYLRKTYGLTLEDYDLMLKSQNGACAICGAKPKPNRSLSVDHNHKTGVIRGLLCFHCNKYLVSNRTFKDIENIYKYLLARDDGSWRKSL